MIGKNKKRVVLKTPKCPILSAAHIYDHEGNEVVQDRDRDVKYTVLLSSRNPIPSKTEGEGGPDVSNTGIYQLHKKFIII